MLIRYQSSKISNSQINWGHASIESQRVIHPHTHQSSTCPTICSAFPACSCAAAPQGPFFLASDLPADTAERDRLLLEVMGSGHPLQIDGIGGGNALDQQGRPSTSRPDADVDYLFAQVRVEQQVVDTSPNCGNMLAP